jgi:hypothetical protein
MPPGRLTTQSPTTTFSGPERKKFWTVRAKKSLQPSPMPPDWMLRSDVESSGPPASRVVRP